MVDLSSTGRTRHFFLIFIVCTLFLIPFSVDIEKIKASAGIGSGEQDERDDFILMPNYRWENITESEGITEGLIGDIYYINASENANFTKARMLNSREIEFESRFLLDVGGQGHEYWEDVKNNVSDFEDNTTEYWQIYDDGVDGDQGSLNGLDVINNEIWLNLQIDNDPEGYATINSTDSLSIDSSIYKWLIIEWFFNDSAAAYRGIDEINVYDSEYNEVGSNDTGWGDYNVTYITQVELNSVEWTSTETDIRIEFLANGTDFDTEIWINYIYLYEFENGADYSSTDGFKFSFLNRDLEEGMYFEFTHNYTDLDPNNYTCNIGMNANSGSDLTKELSFDYLANRDGWLYLELEFDLGRKDLDILFEYENGTDIARYRRFTSVFSSINSSFIPSSDLVLLEEGFPYLALNNTIGELAQSHVMIDFIQSNFRLNTWVEPAIGSSWVFDVVPSDTLTQCVDSVFTSIGQYGMEVHENKTGEKYYYQSIDRLDGFSFNFRLDMSSTDASDETLFYFQLSNVNVDGSLTDVFILRVRGEDGVFSQVSLFSNDYPAIHMPSGSLNDPKVSGKVTTYVDEMEKVFVSIGVDHETTDEQDDVSIRYNSSSPYTNEYVVIFGFSVDTMNGATNSDDKVSFLIESLDIQRKDIIGMFVGGIINGIIGFIQGIGTFLFGWIIPVFMFVGKIIVDGLGDLGKFLEPLFDVLGDFLSDIADALGEVADSIMSAFIPWAEDILEAAMEGLMGLMDLFVELITNFVFWLWNFGGSPGDGLPDILAWVELGLVYMMEFSLWFVETCQKLIDLAVDLSWIILVVWWAWAIPIQWALAEFDPLAGLGNFIGAFFADALPISIIGIKIYFPQGIIFTFWLLAILPADFALFGMMS